MKKSIETRKDNMSGIGEGNGQVFPGNLIHKKQEFDVRRSLGGGSQMRMG
jgi:hypothetical protein